MSQLEELKKTRTELEEESHSLTEEQKECDEMVKMLKERIAIEELKKSNKLTRETISQLRSEMNVLDQRLRELSQEGASASSEDAKPEEALDAPKLAEDEVVTVAAFEDSVETQHEEAVELKNKEEKRRRFF